MSTWVDRPKDDLAIALRHMIEQYRAQQAGAGCQGMTVAVREALEVLGNERVYRMRWHGVDGGKDQDYQTVEQMIYVWPWTAPLANDPEFLYAKVKYKGGYQEVKAWNPPEDEHA